MLPTPTATEETCDCGICGQKTPMTGTRRCDRCYELEKRIQADPQIAINLVAQHLSKRFDATFLMGVLAGSTLVFDANAEFGQVAALYSQPQTKTLVASEAYQAIWKSVRTMLKV